MIKIETLGDIPEAIKEEFFSNTDENIDEPEDLSNYIIEEWEYLNKPKPAKKLNKNSGSYVRQYKATIGNINIVTETEYNPNEDGYEDFIQIFLID